MLCIVAWLWLVIITHTVQRGNANSVYMSEIIHHFLKLWRLVLGDYNARMPWFSRQINILSLTVQKL